MEYVFIFIFGLIVGSFLNALIDRLETGETMLHGRSHCDHCGHVLEPIDLVPLFSWLFLRGRCRYCKEKISIHNPLVEFATGTLFVFSFEVVRVLSDFGGDWYGFVLVGFLCLISAVSVVIFVYDLYHQIILDSVLVFLLAVVVILHIVTFIKTGQLFWGASLLNIGLSAVFSALPYFVIILVTNGKGMGGGDMKLAFVMGALLGSPRIVIAHYIAFLIGGAIGVLLLLFGKKKMGQAIAFGPFLIIGMLVALFWGDILLDSYWFGFLMGY